VGQAFRQQVAVVTGGSVGIGYAIAEQLSREGARLVIGARGKEELEAAAASLRKGGRECRAVPCDVTIPQQLDRLVEAGLERWDRLDILVANAGVGLSGEFRELERDDLRRVFDVNVHGVLNSIQAVLPHMISRGSGRIVLVSSVLGFRGVPGFSGYCATKAALNSLAESLHAELSPRGIHVMLACPGLTETRFHESRLGPASVSDARGKLKAQDPGECGRHIVKALRKNKRRVVLTPDGRLLARLSRHVPNLTDGVIGHWYRRLSARTAAD
jgi:short-subunit dehydrogenase